MCGIAGVITSKPYADNRAKKAFMALLLAMSERGTDGTGVSVVLSNMKNFTTKSHVPSYDFVRLPVYSALSRHRLSVIMGHTREAAVGEANGTNAHPFVKGKIVGCHNGMVDNYLEIDKKVAVDSEVIFDLIDKEGAKEAFAKLSGSFAVTYIDRLKTEPTIHFVRHGNPIYVAVPSADTLFWSSTVASLCAVLTGCYYPDLAVKSIYEVSEDTLTTIVARDGHLISERTPITFKVERNVPAILAVESIMSNAAENIAAIDENLSGGCDLCSGHLTERVYLDSNDYLYCVQCANEYGEFPSVQITFETTMAGVRRAALVPIGVPPFAIKPMTVYVDINELA